MKRIVLSEGKRDVFLVEQFFERIGRNVEIDTFHASEVAKEEVKGQETRKIQNFMERRNPYDLLVKSEGGKPDLKRIFTKLIRSLSAREMGFVLLIDLDNRPLSALFDELNQKVRGNYDGNEYGIEMTEKIGEDTDIIAAEALFFAVDDSTTSSFDVLAFKKDLEHAAGIPSPDDTDEERINELLTEYSSVRRQMKAVLL
ncbi:hypothetical protein [Halolamina sp.]|uniref:hypothetical protein n=1 Tax=Halolamina sp. TaxID=1940283 RepID=UPI00356532BC